MLENVETFEIEKAGKTLEIELYWGYRYNIYIRKITIGDKEFNFEINICELLKTDRMGDFIRIQKNIKNKNLENMAEELTGKKFTAECLALTITKDFRGLLESYIHDCDLMQEKERDNFDKKLIEDNAEIDLSYSTSGGYSFDRKKDSNRLQKYEKMLNDNKKLFDNKDLFKGYASKFDYGDYSLSFWYKIPMEKLMEIMKVANTAICEANKKKIEREEREKERVQKLFELAKETGERQAIESWTEPCNDPHEECNIDQVVLYVLPNGSKKTERYHTW